MNFSRFVFISKFFQSTVHIALLIFFCTAQGALASTPTSCSNLFPPNLTQPTFQFESTRQQLENARGRLRPSARRVDDYLKAIASAVANSSDQTGRIIDQMQKESHLSLHRNTREDLPTSNGLQDAVLNFEAPLFNQIAPKIFPENFKPNQDRSWDQVKKRIQSDPPFIDILRFLNHDIDFPTDAPDHQSGRHYLGSAQSRLIEILNESIPAFTLRQRKLFELAVVARISRFHPRPPVASRLYKILFLIDFPSEAIQLKLLDQWIEKFAIFENPDPSTESPQARSPLDRQLQLNLESALDHFRLISDPYSLVQNEHFLWRLTADPSLLRFILKSTNRLSPELDNFIRTILENLTSGRLEKKGYGLALEATKYMVVFELDLDLATRSLEILSQAQGVYPYIRKDAKKILQGLRRTP
jgi:hypothetical protein